MIAHHQFPVSFANLIPCYASFHEFVFFKPENFHSLITGHLPVKPSVWHLGIQLVKSPPVRGVFGPDLEFIGRGM